MHNDAQQCMHDLCVAAVMGHRMMDQGRIDTNDIVNMFCHTCSAACACWLIAARWVAPCSSSSFVCSSVCKRCVLSCKAIELASHAHICKFFEGKPGQINCSWLTHNQKCQDHTAPQHE